MTRPRLGVLLLSGVRHQASYAPLIAAHPRLLLVDPLLEALADVLRDGGRRVVTLTPAPETVDWQKLSVDPIVPVVLLSKDWLEKGLGILGSLSTTRPPSFLNPLVVLRADAGTDVAR